MLYGKIFLPVALFTCISFLYIIVKIYKFFHSTIEDSLRP